MNIFPCQSSPSYSQKNWLQPNGFLTSSIRAAIRRAAAGSVEGRHASRRWAQAAGAAYLTCFGVEWMVNPWCLGKTNHLEVPRAYQNGGCDHHSMANKTNNIRFERRCLETYEGSSTRASRVSEAIRIFHAPRTMDTCN